MSIKILALSLSVLTITACTRPGDDNAAGNRVAVLAETPAEAGLIDVAYAISRTDFEAAFSEVSALVLLAEAGSDINEKQALVARKRDSALGLLRKVHLHGNIDPEIRSRFSSSLLDASQIEDIEISDIDPKLAACIERSNMVSEEMEHISFNPTDVRAANIAILWMLQELLRQVMGNYETPALNRLGKYTSVDCGALVKGSSLTSTEFTFDLEADQEHLLLFSTSHGGFLMQVIDPSLSPTVLIHGGGSPKTTNLLLGSFNDRPETKNGPDSFRDATTLLEDRLRFWEEIETEARSVLVDLDRASSLAAEITALHEKCEAQDTRIQEIKTQITTLKRELEQASEAE